MSTPKKTRAGFRSPLTLGLLGAGIALFTLTGMALVQHFTAESRARSWFYMLSTLVVIAGLLTAVVMTPWWPLQLVLSVLAGLTIVRGFIIYHDFQHGALLKGSALARAIFNVYGLLVLTPPQGMLGPDGNQ